eukprot:SAG31_NODE_12840_length_913_cov_0.863636_2_plen_63_part_00
MTNAKNDDCVDPNVRGWGITLRTADGCDWETSLVRPKFSISYGKDNTGWQHYNAPRLVNTVP